MSTVAVSGSSGFIGSTVCKYLRANGHKVIELKRDNQSESEWDLSFSVEQNESLLQNADAVIHLAAYIPANYADLNLSEQCFRLNALGTLNLVRAAKNVGVKQFIHASTAAIYSKSNDPLSEVSPTIPFRATAYLASKLAAESYVVGATEGSDMRAAVMRLGAVYGSGMAKSGLLPKCVDQLKSSNLFIIDNANKFQTDFIHVSDVASALLKALEKRVDGIFNIASGINVSALVLAETVAFTLGLESYDIKILPENHGFSYVTPPISVEKARNLLGLQPISLADGVGDYIKSLGIAR